MTTRFERCVALSVTVGVLAMSLVGVAWAAAHVAAPEVLWRATGMTVDLPEVVRPGYTLFTIDADAGTSDSLAIFQVREGVTIEEFAEASGRVDQAYEGAGDVATAINEALAMVEAFHAEVGAEAGERRSVGVVLSEGRYVLEYTPAQDGSRRSYHEMRVEGTPEAEPPTPEASISFVDFAFAIPADLAAGEQTWHVINRGAQIHHMVIFRLQEGATLDDFMEFLEQGPPAEDDAPPEGADAPEAVATPADYIGIMSSGEESYHVVDLEAGTYVAVCFLPDHLGEQTGMPHFMLGMIQEFAVGRR